MRKNEDIIRVPELEDFCGTLGELKNVVDSLVSRRSEYATIMFSAGYNNISVFLKTAK